MRTIASIANDSMALKGLLAQMTDEEMRRKMMKKYLNLLLLSCLLLFSNLGHTNFYTALSLGGAKYLNKDSWSVSDYRGIGLTIYGGYKFPVLIAAEAFYKYLNSSMLGVGGRLFPLPFTSFKAGIVNHFYENEKDNTKFRYYGGVGFNFDLLPIIDIFADLTYIDARNSAIFNGEVGVRYNF